MNIKKLLLIVGIFVFIFAFTLNTSFAATSEKLSESKSHSIITYDKKISKIEIDSIRYYGFYNGYEYTKNCKINIKDSYKNKYKIKSIDIKYQDNNYNSKVKRFNVYNKNSFLIIPKNGISIEKISINYKTKGKVKKETTNFMMDNSWKKTTYFKGKKSNIKLIQKGYTEMVLWEDWSTTTYQNFQIKTKNKKYKIKKVKLRYHSSENIEHKNKGKTFKGNGKK